jgi:hypothetical protein
MPNPTATWTVDNWTRSELWDTDTGLTNNSKADTFLPSNCVAERVIDKGANHFQVYGWRHEKKVNTWSNQMLSDPMVSSKIFHDSVLYTNVAPAYCNGVCEPQIGVAHETSNFDVTGNWFGIVHYKRITKNTPRLVLSNLVSTNQYLLKLKVNGLLRNTDYSPTIETDSAYPFNVTTVKLNGTALDSNGIVTLTLPGVNTTLNIDIQPNWITEKYIRWSGVSVESFIVKPQN